MAKAEIIRDHEGRLHLGVNGVQVDGAIITGMQLVGEAGMCAAIYIPLKHAAFSEASGTVIPFRRPGG